LIVDDDPTIRLLSRKIVERAGFDSGSVENGLLAIEAVYAGAFDLILMDVQMPVLGGIEATEAIRKHERGQLAHTPIVGYSAHGNSEECMQAGMDDFIQKPAAIGALTAKLRLWLEPKAQELR
jgi:protein-histidine pros-kinase